MRVSRLPREFEIIARVSIRRFSAGVAARCRG